MCFVPCYLDWLNICIDQTYTYVLISFGQKLGEGGEIYLIMSVEFERA